MYTCLIHYQDVHYVSKLNIDHRPFQIDMTRVKLDVLKPWIGQRVANFLNGLEDDVIVEFVFNQLEDKVSVIQNT